MTTTAENLPDDVVERARVAFGYTDVWASFARTRVAQLLDAGIVALVPDVIRREPCETCGGEGRHGDIPKHDCKKGKGENEGQRICLDHVKPLCPTCGGSGKRPADAPIGRYQRASEQVGIESETSQHGHDTAACSGCREVYDAGHRFGADPPYRGMTPPADGLPGDGWVRYRVSTDGARVQIHAYNDAWWEMNASPMALNVHPDSAPEPAPRPTDGWEFNIGLYDDDGFWWHEWFWWSLLEETGVEVTSGTERTREKAVQAAEKARAEWDTRLAGGAS